MKKYALLLCLMSIIMAAGAQQSAKYLKLKEDSKYKEGYIITSNAELIKGLIRHSNYRSDAMYRSIRFVSEDGNKVTYYASDLQGYGCDDFEFVTYGGEFYKVVQKGEKVNLYRRVEVGRTNPGMNANSSVYIQDYFYLCRNGSSRFEQVQRFGFKKEMPDYFEDCDELSTKIANKTYSYEDMEEIVKIYNACE